MHRPLGGQIEALVAKRHPQEWAGTPIDIHGDHIAVSSVQYADDYDSGSDPDFPSGVYLFDL